MPWTPGRRVYKDPKLPAKTLLSDPPYKQLLQDKTLSSPHKIAAPILYPSTLLLGTRRQYILSTSTLFMYDGGDVAHLISARQRLTITPSVASLSSIQRPRMSEFKEMIWFCPFACGLKRDDLVVDLREMIWLWT